jgi:hypothetical protein
MKAWEITPNAKEGSSMNVVFTGPAFDSNGHSIVRSELAYACLCKGNLSVQSSVRGDTDVLVASRTDTVKAKNASLRGIAVFTYPEFIAKFLQDVPIKLGGKPNHYTDKVDTDLLVPDFTKGKSLEQLDLL